jgi:hypothetical protein
MPHATEICRRVLSLHAFPMFKPSCIIQSIPVPGIWAARSLVYCSHLFCHLSLHAVKCWSSTGVCSCWSIISLWPNSTCNALLSFEDQHRLYSFCNM